MKNHVRHQHPRLRPIDFEKACNSQDVWQNDIHVKRDGVRHRLDRVGRRSRHFTNKKHSNYLPWIHTSTTQIILCIIFSMYVATIQCLNYRGQESKACSLHFWHISDLETKSSSSNLEWQCRPPSKIIIMQGLKDLALMMSEKKANDTGVFQMRKYVNYLPWIGVKTKNSSIFMIYLT